ncbi:MAG: GNAT family N-acetyltransferase [Ignavibacteria bacterium]|nr:GNAT family N-acetyltransferase [Ignavibacteria bacterium]
MIAYKIRDAIQNDFEAAYNIKKDALQSYVDKTWGWNEEFQRKYHEKHFDTKNLQIIEVQKKPVGSLEILDKDDHLLISGLYIIQKFQSKNIGSTIIRNIIEDSKSKKRTIKLNVLKANERAKQLYESLGFETYMVDNIYYKMIYRHNK